MATNMLIAYNILANSKFSMIDKYLKAGLSENDIADVFESTLDAERKKFDLDGFNEYAVNLVDGLCTIERWELAGRLAKWFTKNGLKNETIEVLGCMAICNTEGEQAAIRFCDELKIA